MAKVCIGIVTYNSLADLPACFAGLRAQTYPQIMVHVLDNASQEDCVGWLYTNAPEIRLLKNDQNVGFARGHNRLLESFDLQPGDYYLPLNPDVRLMPTYVSVLVETLQRTGGGWAIGKLLMIDERGTLSGRLYSVGHAIRRDGYVLNIGYGLPDEAQFSQPREVFGAPGAASLIAQELIQAVAEDGALYDTTMFLYGEDTDLDWRARRAGWRCCYAPDAVAWHRGSQANAVLRIQALGNRYLSVLKNAFLIDLLLYNVPLIGLHCLARLVLTPRRGVQLIAYLMRLAPIAWRKRRPARISRAAMHEWFRWSAAQSTGQLTTFRARWEASQRHA